MAKLDVSAVAERLFGDFVAPLVLGGEMTPGRPIGARTALAIGDGRKVADIDKAAHVQLARVRVARKLAPIDRLEPLGAHDWALCAALHDLVQTTHPDLKTPFRPRAPRKLLDLVGALVERIPGPASVLDALSRHTLLSRLFEITRTDTTVSWWVGSSVFLGTDPPPRLLAWPKVRRVDVARTPRPLMALPISGGAVDPEAFETAVRALLAKTPLTDLATAGRPEPRFEWTPESLGLMTTRAGRTLVGRALAIGEADAVDDALGRATRALLEGRSWRLAAFALDALAERALRAAEFALANPNAAPTATQGDAAFARAAGAFAARRWIAMHGDCFAPREREGLANALEPAATSPAARELERLIAPAVLDAAPPSEVAG